MFLLTATVEPPFHPLGKAGQQRDDDQVHDADDEPHLKRAHYVGVHILGGVDQLREADDRQDRGILEGDDKLVDD